MLCVSGFHQRLWVLSRQITYVGKKFVERLGDWQTRRVRRVCERLAAAEAKFVSIIGKLGAEYGEKTQSEWEFWLRAQWKHMHDFQSQPASALTSKAADQMVGVILALEDSVEALTKRIEALHLRLRNADGSGEEGVEEWNELRAAVEAEWSLCAKEKLRIQEQMASLGVKGEAGLEQLKRAKNCSFFGLLFRLRARHRQLSEMVRGRKMAQLSVLKVIADNK